MEKHIFAMFLTAQDLNKAEARLKQQGVIDLARPSFNQDSENEFAEEIIGANETDHTSSHYGLHVYVEPSRFNQAVETINNCNGKI